CSTERIVRITIALHSAREGRQGAPMANRSVRDPHINHRRCFASLVDRFRWHLQVDRGATDKTCREYGRYVGEFLESLRGSRATEISRLEPTDVMHFVAGRATRCRPKTAKLVATSLRSFLRFLQMQGLCDDRLAGAVPTVPEWRLSRIPKAITECQLR